MSIALGWMGLALASDGAVRFVGDGAEVLAFDGAGQVLATCTSPCEVPLTGGSQLFVPGGGGKPLMLDPTAHGRVYRVTSGAPTRRLVGMILAMAGAATSSVVLALDSNPQITVGAGGYFGPAAVTATGLALTIRSRPRFVEESLDSGSTTSGL